MIQWVQLPVSTMAEDSVTCARTTNLVIFHQSWSRAELLAGMTATMAGESWLLTVYVDDDVGEYPKRTDPI